MSDQLEAEFERLHADLLKHGYRDIEEFRGLKVGARVRHRGQRYSDAYRKGTGVIRALTRKDPSSWERKYGRPDVELLVQRDESLVALGMSRFGQWADYHTDLAKEQP